MSIRRGHDQYKDYLGQRISASKHNASLNRFLPWSSQKPEPTRPKDEVLSRPLSHSNSALALSRQPASQTFKHARRAILKTVLARRETKVSQSLRLYFNKLRLNALRDSSGGKTTLPRAPSSDRQSQRQGTTAGAVEPSAMLVSFYL